MQCCKCMGRFVYERFLDGGRSFIGLRCINCGEIIDPLIIHHRLERKAATKKRAKTTPSRLPFIVKSD